MPSQDVWKFIPVYYKTSALSCRCTAVHLHLELITVSEAPLTMCDPWMTSYVYDFYLIILLILLGN